MTIETARAIIERDRDAFDPYDAMDAIANGEPYFPEYQEACAFAAKWDSKHGVSAAGRVFRKQRCRKCGGTGHLMCYDHVDRGRCWSCDGLGYIEVYE